MYVTLETKEMNERLTDIASAPKSQRFVYALTPWNPNSVTKANGAWKIGGSRRYQRAERSTIEFTGEL